MNKFFDEYIDHDTSDVQTKVRYVNDKIEKTVNELVTVREINEQYSQEWYSQQLRDLKNQRNNAEQRAGMLNSSDSWSQYRQLRNRYNKMCQIQKDESIKRVIEDNIHDSRRLWKELNKIVKGQSQMITFMYFESNT